MKNNLTVTKSNDLILKTAYKLSLLELRILLFAIAKMNPLQQNLPEKHILDARVMAEIYNVPLHKFWQQISVASETLFKREIRLKLSDTVTKISRWLYDVELDSGTKVITFMFHREVLEHLHAFENKFTSYQLENIVQMGSTYSIRFYEWSILHLKASKKDSATYQKTVQELKETLDLGDKYPQLGDFKKRVLDVAKEEINNLTDVHFSYHIERSGHAIKYIEFTARYNKRHKEDSETLPVLENNHEEPTNQRFDDMPDFLNGEEQPPMPDNIEYNQNNYTPKKQATMEETNMTTYNAVLDTTPPTSHAKREEKYAINQHKRDDKDAIREERMKELLPEEIDTCTDVIKLSHNINDCQQRCRYEDSTDQTKLPTFEQSDGRKLNMFEIEHVKTARLTKRLEELYAQGYDRVPDDWQTI